MDVIVIFLRLLLMLLGLTVPDSAAPPPPEETFRSLTVIEAVDARVLESYPVQVVLDVTGYQPDGCEFPVEVEQARSGSTVTVEIFRNMPLAVACPAVIVPYSASIPLEGTFEPGTYTIEVNGFTLELSI